MTEPARSYYLACRGHWLAPVSITIDDVAQLATSGMSWFDRVGIRLLAAWPAWLGRVWLDTTVAFHTEQEVIHTTTIRWLGLPLKRSVERYALQADGVRLIVTGDMTGEGSVDPTATRATYALRWLGAQITQQTLRDGDTVTVDQRGPGFHGVQALVRQPT